MPPEFDNPASSTVPVALAGRSYDILIGRNLLPRTGGALAALAPGARAAIVTDENVASRHLPALEGSLKSAGITSISMILKPGEATKNWSDLGHVVDRILAEKLERGDLVIAFGGGVVGDLTGFAAAIVRRGMRYVQIPTTLLSQVDSSVGGKTAVNSPHGKNLIGAFHQPVMVIADTSLLDTLSEREFKAGYAEVVKYGLIDKPDFFEWLEAGAWRGIFSGGPEREEAVRISCAAKAAVVARDETELGDRALLNLGHTFGHALESITGYNSSRLVHGEGVAIGMALAHRFSQSLGLCNGQDGLRVTRHIEAVGLPTRLSQVPGGVGSVDALMHAIRQDKKVAQGRLTFILTRGIGQSFIAKDIEASAVERFLAAELAAN